eukprot:PITA_25926
MLHDQGLPLHLWVEACNTFVYLHNRSPLRILEMSTPEEDFSGKKPDVAHFRVFRSSFYCHVTKDAWKKLVPTAELGIFVVYTDTPQNYWVYLPFNRMTMAKEVTRSVHGYMALMRESVEVEPSSFKEAVQQPVWVDAMVEEYASIIRNNVWEVVPRPADKSVVSSRWLYKIKQATYGSVEKHKAIFVARGFSQVEEID